MAGSDDTEFGAESADPEKPAGRGSEPPESTAEAAADQPDDAATVLDWTVPRAQSTPSESAVTPGPAGPSGLKKNQGLAIAAVVVAIVLGVGLFALVNAGGKTKHNSNPSNTPTVAARVNGTVISTAELEADTTSAANDAAFRCLIGAGANAPNLTAMTGGKHNYGVGFVDVVLSDLIRYNLSQQLLKRYSLTTPASLTAVATQQLDTNYGQALVSHQCAFAKTAVLAGLSSGFRSLMIGAQAGADVVYAHLGGASLDPVKLASYEKTHPAVTIQSCTSIIQVKKRSLALQIEAAVKKGTPFTSETKQSVAKGIPANGSVGCVLNSEWATSLDKAVSTLKVGVVSDPVAYQGSWVLFYVSKRQKANELAIVNQFAQQQQTAFQSAFQFVSSHTQVSVASMYGSWSAATGAMVPPASATTTTSTVAGTTVPSSSASTVPTTSFPTPSTVPLDTTAVVPTCPPAGSSKRVVLFSKAPPDCIGSTSVWDVTFDTSAGSFVVEMDASKSYAAVNNFVFLAGWHYYDGTFFHRVITGFVVQGGDPAGTGTGGAHHYPGYMYTGNTPPKACATAPTSACYATGDIAMANTGAPTSNESQFFLVLPGGAKILDTEPNYTDFGHVTSGLGVVEKIGAWGSTSGTPVVKVFLLKVTAVQVKP